MDRKRILLVEDEAVTAMDISNSLYDLGYDVAAVVSTGEAAILKAAALQPDLVLMDITLAGSVNGIEAAGEIRKTCSMPIVFLTAHADAETIGQAKTTEPFGYLLKPCTRGTLMSVLEIALYKGEADAQRRKAEQALRKMEEELVKARNLEALGILAGGIAHDFNNLLQGLLGNISMAKHYTPETSKAFPLLEEAEALYPAVSRLTGQLIAFSKGGLLVRKTIQPARLIHSTVLLTMTGSTVRPVFDLPEDLWDVRGDAEQFAQAIGNITLNSREAMPSGGTLLVSAANVRLEDRDVAGLAPGRYIKISIRDSGCGIAPDILPRIFDPYFSTRERGDQKGMGLGLTVSNAIIRKHNGVITAESEPGNGSTFTLYLPVG